MNHQLQGMIDRRFPKIKLPLSKKTDLEISLEEYIGNPEDFQAEILEKILFFLIRNEEGSENAKKIINVNIDILVKKAKTIAPHETSIDFLNITLKFAGYYLYFMSLEENSEKARAYARANMATPKGQNLFFHT